MNLEFDRPREQLELMAGILEEGLNGIKLCLIEITEDDDPRESLGYLIGTCRDFLRSYQVAKMEGRI